MKVVVSVAVLLSSASAASALGGFSCYADDENVKLELQAGVTRGMGSPILGFSGRSELTSGREVADDLRVTEFTRSHVPQYWQDGQTLKVRLYRERESDAPHGFVEIVVDTAYDDASAEYTGDYRLMVYDMTKAENSLADTVELAGAVACISE